MISNRSLSPALVGEASLVTPLTDKPMAAPRTSNVQTHPEFMNAVFQTQYGESDVLQFGQRQVPQPGERQVLIKVEAAGLDRGTWHMMSGKPYLLRVLGFGFKRPKQPVPGMDVSGRVVAVGSEVTEWAPGDAVFGIGSGTFAQYAIAEAEKLAPRPDSIDRQQAAALPISGLTALQALRDAGELKAGQRVLVVGASGGVGTLTVQLAKHFGAHVTGIASTGKLEHVSAAGADCVIDYTADDFFDQPDQSQRYDLIIDTGGRNSIRRLRSVLAEAGTLVIVGGEDGGNIMGGLGRQIWAMLLSPFVRQNLKMLVSEEGGNDIKILGQLLADGKLRSAVKHQYRLSDAVTAMDDLVAGRISGKAVIQVADSSS